MEQPRGAAELSVTTDAPAPPRRDVTVLVLEAARFLGSHSDNAQDHENDYCADSESHNYAKSDRRHLSEGSRIAGLSEGNRIAGLIFGVAKKPNG